MRFKLLVIALLSFKIVEAKNLQLPENGGLFGAYVDAGPLSDTVTYDVIQDIENQLETKLSWIYFSNNWLNGEIKFPTSSVEEILKAGRIPYIRLMPWSEVRTTGADPIYTMDAFLNGDYDEQLMGWAIEAKKYNTHYILEFGPEVNGEWFAWNGRWNGAGNKKTYGDPNLPDGAEKFADVYKKIVTLFREQGLETNVTWVLHFDTAGSPAVSWNRAKYYYPGDDYVDWIGLSVFGAQLPTHRWGSFEDKFRYFWPQIKDLALRKPIIISEFAVIEDFKKENRKAQWLEDTFTFVRSQEFPIKAVTYWNSPGWLEDESADFRINSSESSLNYMKNELKNNFWEKK